MIAEIITLLRKKTKYKYEFTALSSTKRDGVAYEFTDVSCDGIKSAARLKLHIICTGTNEAALVRAEEMKNKINNTIVTTADNPLTPNILTVRQNGGGNAVDLATGTTHKILYYDVIYRRDK